MRARDIRAIKKLSKYSSWWQFVNETNQIFRQILNVISMQFQDQLDVQQSLKERLQLRLQQLVKKVLLLKMIHVKVTRDGTHVSRSMHIQVIAFTKILIHLGGNHIIAHTTYTKCTRKVREPVRRVLPVIKNLYN